MFLYIIENQSVLYYPFGYEHYLEKQSHCAQVKAEEQALIIGLRSVPTNYTIKFVKMISINFTASLISFVD